MFCPGCGIEDRQGNQYCRACGTDLRVVRTAVERPDSITASATGAREAIGRSIAAKIGEVQSAKELKKVVEEVLPEVEKFLESPEEKRLRRLRVGSILSCIGVGVAIALTVAGIATGKEDFFFLAALGVVTFFIGLAFFLNGTLLTVPKKTIAGGDAGDRRLDGIEGPTNELVLPEARPRAAGLSSTPGSVTENTTRHLTENN
jgi:hypothetical protein